MEEKKAEMRARFAQVNLVIADMDRSIAFYRLIGVEVGDMPPPWSSHHSTIANVDDDVTAEFDSVVSVANWAPAWDSVRPGVVVGFVVDSDYEVDSAVERIAGEGHRILQQPHDAFFGARYAVAEDPDGIAVGIMGPIDDTRISMPEPPS